MSKCPVCNSSATGVFFERNGVPVANNIICHSYEEAQAFPQGDLCFMGCHRCGFAWNRCFDPSLVPYTDAYENNQACSPHFKAHFEAVLDRLPLPEHGVEILEIGCGQGTFLKHAAQTLGSRLHRAVGFDPALRQEHDDGVLKLVQGLADGQRLPSDFRPNIVISRHVIEHVASPHHFIKSILHALPVSACHAQDSACTLVLETPSLEWILSHEACYDMYYEHCSLFSLRSLKTLMQSYGFSCSASFAMFSDQYRVACFCREDELQIPDEAGSFEEPFSAFLSGYEVFQKKWADRLRGEFCGKSLAIWGAASKATTFLNMCREYESVVVCAIDINEGRQQHYIPCSTIRIVSPAEASLLRPDVILISNPAYCDEIKAIGASVGMHPQYVVLR